MGGPIAADTPDYQRGVVNAQKLLAAPSAKSSVIVSPPPNTESMILIADQPSSPSDVVWCLGQTSSAYAPVYRLPAPNGVNFNGAWIFDVSSVIDSSYEVYYGNGSHTRWYVYADVAARLVVDGSKLTDLHGQQYVIPTVPSTLTGDHPPVELQQAAIYGSADTNFIAAPGAGKRLRLFYATLSFIPSGTGNAQLVGTVSGTNYILSQHPACPPVSYYPSGLPMAANDGLRVGLSVGGTFASTVVYTTETI